MRKGIICLVILNLMVLSSWEGLSILHSLLHKIPNPFHYHVAFPKYSHHHDHPHPHNAAHNFNDHLEKENIVEDGSSPVSGKSEASKQLKEFFKINWKLEEEQHFLENRYNIYQISVYSSIQNFSSSFKNKPTVPPPRIS